MKNWLRAQPTQPATIGHLQVLLDRFQDQYNHRRPDRSLPHHATPATAYAARPKAAPSTDRTADTHDRIRRDKIDDTGAVTLCEVPPLSPAPPHPALLVVVLAVLPFVVVAAAGCGTDRPRSARSTGGAVGRWVGPAEVLPAAG
jgi:hypothetical protein